MTLFAELSEPLLRLLVFVLVFAVMALWEVLLPRRRLVAPKALRWRTNLSIIALDSAMMRGLAMLTVPVAAVAAALWAEGAGWGLLNQLDWPPVIEILITILVLDLAIWLQHVASHKVPVLWRLHRMHHADRDIDVTTGARFHPIEIALSMLYKIVWVVALGAPAVGVIAFEVILNGCAMFNHANVRLPRRLDALLRLLIVTPDMHRVHHSTERREHDSNYGFNLSIWDRMFGTYVPQPAAGHDGMTIGLAPYQSNGPSRLGWSLALPFRGKARS